MRLVLAALTVLVMGCAVAGVGMGQATAEGQRAPGPAAVAAATQRIAAGGATTARGRELFEDQGCDACHSIAAIGAEGKLGPRLDALDDDADDIAESITEPREDIVDGFPENLMPDDYAQRMGDEDVQALAAFVAAASGADEAGGEGDGGGEDSGRGRGRGRGRGGNSGSGGGGGED
jgi:cytochrome c5